MCFIPDDANSFTCFVVSIQCSAIYREPCRRNRLKVVSLENEQPLMWDIADVNGKAEIDPGYSWIIHKTFGQKDS